MNIRKWLFMMHTVLTPKQVDSCLGERAISPYHMPQVFSMTEFSNFLQQGNAWLFMPSAIVLGALHGLEPGHSKTMMAAFIIAIRGTVTQAVLLGLSATFSHTVVVWIAAMAGLYFGRNWQAETSEAYFQVASSIFMIGVACWILWRTWKYQQLSHTHTHSHSHDHDHGQSKHAGILIETGHGMVCLEISESGASPRFRLSEAGRHGHSWPAEQVSVTLERRDGSREFFTFKQGHGCVESEQEVPEPHDFTLHLHLGHGSHSHDYDVEFVENTQNAAAHTVADLVPPTTGFQDPHELAHANDIRRHFTNRNVTTWQIVLFGLTGGLIPCPASITILLLCLQLKKIALGATLVLCFSVGLALTMVTSGAVAAIGTRHVAARWNGFDVFARKAPYFSGLLIVAVGLYTGYLGLRALL